MRTFLGKKNRGPRTRRENPNKEFRCDNERNEITI